MIEAFPDFSRLFREAVGLAVDQVHAIPMESGVYARSGCVALRRGFVSTCCQIPSITGKLV